MQGDRVTDEQWNKIKHEVHWDLVARAFRVDDLPEGNDKTLARASIALVSREAADGIVELFRCVLIEGTYYLEVRRPSGEVTRRPFKWSEVTEALKQINSPVAAGGQ
jgi:hypothetical protein